MKEAKEHSEREGLSPGRGKRINGRGIPPVLLEALRPYGALFGEKAPLLLGFSGGPDSLALGLALTEALGNGHQARKPPLLALHVDHGWGPASAEMAEQARDLARSMGVPFRLRRVRGGRGETGARRARYGVFAAVAREEGAAALFLAHHRDDALETLLHRLLRGTGPLGLACIPRERELRGAAGCRILRPFLGLSKRDLLEALEADGWEPVQDPSNVSPDLSIRHRVRHGLLPRLRARGLGPSLEALLDEACLLREAVEREVAQALRGLDMGVPPTHPPIHGGWAERPALPAFLPVSLLRGMSPWGREELLIGLLRRLDLGPKRPERKHLRQLHRLLEPTCPSGRRMESLGYWTLERRRDMLVLRPAPGSQSAQR